MVKKLLILPYFGPFHSYFPLWLHSCGRNPGTNWLVVTDNPMPSDLPVNVLWVCKTFDELRCDFQKHFPFPICLNNPYKLCDYKVYFGHLFRDYLEGYDFWGYCDCDVIFGDLDKFLPEDLFDKYDKLLPLGHLSFIRNDPKINTLFLNYDTYRIVMTTPIIYGPDEVVEGYHLGLAGELLDQGYRFLPARDLPADIDFRHFPFRVVTQREDICVFTYENGKLRQHSRHNEHLCSTERMYVHLQKRKMHAEPNLDPDSFLVYPNSFAPLDSQLLDSNSFWEQVSRERPDYFDPRAERRQERLRDLRRFLHEPRKLDCLRYRFRK